MAFTKDLESHLYKVPGVIKFIDPEITMVARGCGLTRTDLTDRMKGFVDDSGDGDTTVYMCLETLSVN